MRRVVAAAAFLGLTAAAAIAQTQPSARPPTTDDWKVSIYPIFVWVPLGIDIDVDVPPVDGGSGGSGEIVDGRFDGAFLGGFSAAKGLFRVDGDGLWAGVGGDRPERPFLRVDADVIYVHLTGGVKVVKDLYVIGGVRRLALKYNVALGDLPEFERKPGVWDPLVGLGWHSYYNNLEVHATFEGGGFGVGTDVEYAGAFRLDWKPLSHFGLIGGYNYLYFKLSDDRANRTFTVKQTLHGPVVGIGFYFQAAASQTVVIVGLAPAVKHDLFKNRPEAHRYAPTGAADSTRMFVYAGAAAPQTGDPIVRAFANNCEPRMPTCP